MKYNNIIKYALLAVLTLGAATACENKEFNEITELSLSRCLQPQDLSARVNNANGVDVTFSWDVNKDADSFHLEIYKDEKLTEIEQGIIMTAAEVPYTLTLPADSKYWFRVEAMAEGREASLWAVYDGSVKTFAVKDNLFPEVVGRTENSITIKWAKDLADYAEVTHVSCSPIKGGATVKKEISAAEAQDAQVTVEGLEASTEYQLVLYYLSASRGAMDVWTVGSAAALTVVSDAVALKTGLQAGGNFYLKPGDYNLVAVTEPAGTTVKPAGSIRLVGEIGADGTRPTVHPGKFELMANLVEDGASFYFEGIRFDGDASNSRIVEHTGGALNVKSVRFVNCEITNFQAGLFYDNNDAVIKIEELSFESCDIDGILGSGGDAVDIRKPCEITTLKFVNNTIWDGIRTMFRIDANDAVKIGEIDFENNTVKNIATMDDGNNRGFFAVRVNHNMTLKKNLFLHQNGGKTGEDVDKAQLFQDNAGTVVPALTAADNYSFGSGKDFFKKVSAAEAGCIELSADPCYNSKGNFFQLSNEDLIDKQVGASKWWISYVEKTEDLTQNVIEGPHTWNLQNATLFAGDIKNSRVRDELLLVGTEATPMKADGGIIYTTASVLSRKGVPTEGYVAFKVNKAGSVDLQVSDAENRGGSVVVALADDNGLAVKGGAVARATNSEVEKIVVNPVSGEGTVYVYATGPIMLEKLAWSEDTSAGSKVLPAPKPVVEPVTVTEGDAVAIAVSWDAVPNAASYIVTFNKRAQPAQTDLAFTVPAEDIAALKAGLYNFSVQAFPREDDIYYVKSEAGVASLAIQPKGGTGEVVTVTKNWDFSLADWQAEFAKLGAANTDITNWNLTYDDLTIVSTAKSKYNTTFFQWGGKGSTADRYMKFSAPEQGTLKVWCSNTGSSNVTDRFVTVNQNGEEVSIVGGTPSNEDPTVAEFSVAAGDVYVYCTGNALRFYKLEFTYTTSGEAAVEYDWNFSDADWVAAFEANFTKINNNEKPDFSVNGLDVISGGGTLKYNVHPDGSYFIQMGGKGTSAQRAFGFDAPVAGTLKVWATNTGDSDALDRTVAVAVDGTEVDALPGGYAKVNGAHELEFSISAPGRVTIYGPVNGLCFYHIYFSNK